jgi:membrane protein YqaA with SNARE-associated domain
LSFLKSLGNKLGHALVLYGGWGLFAIAVLDSAGLSMPGVKDLLLIYLSSQHPGRAWIYAAACTLGTALGSFVIYGLGRGSARLVSRRPSTENVSRARRWLERNDFVTIVVASLLPPPLPFKPFLFAAAVLRVNMLRFGAALLVGGAIRFGIEVWVGARYGIGGEEFLKKNIFGISLVAAALVVALALVHRAFRRTPPEPKGPE